jgi:hypothetical protein
VQMPATGNLLERRFRTASGTDHHSRPSAQSADDSSQSAVSGQLQGRSGRWDQSELCTSRQQSAQSANDISSNAASWERDAAHPSVLPGLIVVCFGRLWVRVLPFPNARHLRHPFQRKNTLPWHLGPAAKVRILRFKNLPPFRHDPGLQIPRLRYSPGLVPTTRLNALLKAASDS